VERPLAEVHLSNLRQLLQKHGGAASCGRSQAFFHPPTLKDALAKLPSRKPQLLAQKLQSLRKCMEDADDQLAQGEPISSFVELVQARNSIITATAHGSDRTSERSSYHFQVPHRLVHLLTNNDDRQNQKKREQIFTVPLFAVNMSVDAVLRLRSFIEQMDQLEDCKVP
jgi:hypothetical protein